MLRLLLITTALGLSLCACDGRERGTVDAAADSGIGGDSTTPDTATPPSEPCGERDPRSAVPEVFVGPDGLAARLVALFDDAAATLRVAAYELDDPRIVAGLIDAHGRGVDVRVLVDEARDTNTAPVGELRAAGLDVRDGPDEFRHYHPKVIVVDETRAVVMSANLNTYSMESERNHGVVLSDAFDIADLVDVFDHDWEGRTTDPAAASCTRLVLSPHNSRSRILRLIASAESELRVQHLSMSDDEVRAAIGQRAMNGVSARAILADPFWIESNTEAAEALTALGVEVRFLSTPENHAKLIVADGAAFVGSENLSYTSLELNREVGVVLTAAEAVTPLEAAFDADWTLAVP